MKNKTIALFGSGSHIAKGLINNFLQDGDVCLHLFTRKASNVEEFLSSIEQSSGSACIIHEGYDEVCEHVYDVVINCVGVGTERKLQGNYTSWFTVTEEYDNLAITYLQNVNPNALYISFSSGAIYGKGYRAPAVEEDIYCVKVNDVGSDDYYAICRLNAEAKHRSFKDLSIIDLRIFSYFSRFIDLTDGYFITDVMQAMLTKATLKTNDMNIVRDYVHPNDLFQMVKKCMDAGKLNMAFDVSSAAPVEKQDILDYFSSTYALMYDMVKSLDYASATGSKNIYCSAYQKAADIGYQPQFSSMDTIQKETAYILNI